MRIWCAMLIACVGCTLLACDNEVPPEEDAGTEEDAGPPVMAECPTHLRFTNTSTRRDIGWTGILHSTQVSDGAVFTVEVVDCDDECRHCRLEGPARNSGVNNQRCVRDTRTECTSDDDCTDTGPCRFLYGPPLTIESGPTTTLCITGGFEPPSADERPVTGTIDLLTGDVTFENFIIGGAINRMMTPTGMSAAGACGSCVGDMTPGDGLAEGTCQLAERDDPRVGALLNVGDACDVNGRGGPLTQPTAGFFSFDCVAADNSPAPQIENWGPLSTHGARWTMTDRRPYCTAAGNEEDHCWCGVCSDDGSVCTSDRDCLMGTCGGATDVAVTRPNACVDTCDWDVEAQAGSCEIDIFPGVVAGCYPEGQGVTIEARGAASLREGQYFVTLSSLSCGSVGSENDWLFGAPGPTLNELDFQIATEVRE